MSMCRYALYFAPEDDSALARFGWWWLGRRATVGAYGPLPSVGLDAAFQTALLAEPRRYGFHATLKAPFFLAEGKSADELVETAARFARRQRRFSEPPLVLSEIGDFLALTPSRTSGAILDLAGDCVVEFDEFRAPPSVEEVARRRAAGLSPAEAALLELWGYPYVFESYRFHLTLTGRLPAVERELAHRALAPLLTQVFGEPVEFASVCLFEQPASDRPFVLLERFPFGA